LSGFDKSRAERFTESRQTLPEQLGVLVFPAQAEKRGTHTKTRTVVND
jgi:hypothetical protein